MKKNFSYVLALALGATLLFSACKKEEEEPEPTPDECAGLTFPTTNGTATVNVLNFTTMSGGFTQVNASAGDNLSFAFEVVKGDDRPQKLRIFQTECVNAKGTQVTFAGQQDVANDGTIDLRNTDDAQVRQIVFAVPTGVSTLYLNVEVDESGSKYTYKRIKLNIAGSGLIDTWSNVELGAQSNSRPSRMVSATGQTFTSCNAAANINYIDITYAAIGSSDAVPTILSNPQRSTEGLSTTIPSTTVCNEGETNPSTAGGPATKFLSTTLTSSDFNAITDAAGLTSALSGLTFGTNQKVTASSGSVIAFQSADGTRKGLILVSSLTQGTNTTDADLDGYATVSVKVER